MDSGAAKVELELGKLDNEIESIKRQRAEAIDYLDRMRQVLPTLDQMEASQTSRIGQLESQVLSLLLKTERNGSREETISTLNKIN